MGVEKQIGLRVSRRGGASPAVCGLLKPVILLPHGLDSNLSYSQLRLILMHELAHIKRDDLWVNLLQTILQIVYFYNPLLWLANWMIRRVREQAVDESVQVAMGRNAARYPDTLLTVARLAFERPFLSLRLTGVVESRSALADRIEKMLTRPVPKTSRLGLTGTAVILLMGMFILPMAGGEVVREQDYEVDAENTPSLKTAFSNDFLIGAAVDESVVSGQHSAAAGVVRKHFNTLTTENVLKWETVHPWPKKYDFGPGDKIVEFGQKNKMFIVGHVLVGNYQVPDWVFQNADGSTIDRETLLKRMKNHIFTVVGHYRGRVNAWDVAHGIFDLDDNLEKTKWLEIIGEDYIQKAFEYAHEADPDAELYYTDHNLLRKNNLESTIRLLNKFKSRGIRIDGVGIESHMSMSYPLLNNLENCITALAHTGVPVMITEIDVSVLPDASEYKDKNIDSLSLKSLNPYSDKLPSHVQDALAKRYYDFFTIFHKHADKISRVTFWGINDGQSWLNVWPIKGRTDYPLLFDRNYKPKPAFFAVIKAARNDQ